MYGLLYCPEQKIREDFKTTLSALCSKYPKIDQQHRPLEFFLRIMSDNFKLIFDYPCRQFFDLYSELIDQHFLSQTIGGINGDNNSIDSQKTFNPEHILCLIIDKIRSDKSKDATLE